MTSIVRVIQETVLFLAAMVRSATRSVRENSGLAVLSVVLAFGIWIVVTDAENPTRTRVVPQDITVEPINVPESVAVVEPLPTVRVRVTGAEDVFDSLTAADFQATVDLQGLTVGDYELPVQVRPLTSRGNIRVETVLPEEIEIELAQLVSKEVPVVIDVDGEPVSGFTMEAPELDDQSVLVSGPQEKVDMVAQATATLSVDGRTQTLSQAVRLVPRDNRGVLVEGVSLEPSLTQVMISIEQETFSRAMAISPVTEGNPGSGYNVVSVSVSPATVTVRGNEALITGTASIPTRPVDIDGATEDVVRTVGVDLPSGAEVTGGQPVVTVTVRIEPAEGLFSYAVPVEATNLGTGFSISGSLPVVTVELSGPVPLLQSLSLSSILALVDLTDLDVGPHTVAVEVTVPNEEDVIVQSVTPSNISVTLQASQ